MISCKTLFLWLILIFLTKFCHPQSISGTVVDTNKKALSYVTIALLNPNSTLIKSNLTDKSGRYVFLDIAPGEYMITLSSVGYISVTQKISLIKALNLDSIVLKQVVKNLKAITVTASKPLIDFELDKVVVNVDGTILSKGNSVLDVLKKSPGVSTDISNNIKLNGKDGITILLDGRNSNLSQQDLNTLLAGMSAESVQSIQLMANPSSKYDAAGNGGVINIITKKRKSDGYSLSATTSLSKGENYRQNVSLNYLMKLNKLSIYSNLTFNNTPTKFDFTSDRFISKDTTNYRLNSALSPTSKNYFYRGGIDFQISNKSLIGALVTANFNNSITNYSGLTLIDSFNRQSTDSVTTNILTHAKSHAVGLNLYYDLKIDSAGQGFTINLDHNDYSTTSLGNIENFEYSNPGNQIIDNSTKNRISINSIKIDYTLPISKTLKLEAGVKSSIVTTKNNINYENLIGGVLINDTTKTNTFRLKENINAAYASLSKDFSEKFSAKIGVRAEQTIDKGESLESNKNIQRNYLNIFPTIYLNEKLDSKNNINISYGRRVDRPSYQQLNPFIFYNNPYSYYQGNPFLNPQFSNNYTLGYSLLKKYFFSLNLMTVRGVISVTPSLDTSKNVVTATPNNLDRQTLYYASFSVPIDIFKWWSFYNYLNLYYGSYKSAYQGSTFSVSKPSAYLYSGNTFKLNKSTTFEVSFNYDANQYSGLYYIKSRLQTNLALQKSFLKNNNAIIKINANDIFKKAFNNTIYRYNGLSETSSSYYDIRYIQISLSYNINKLKGSVNSNRQQGSEDEQNRAKK